MHIILIAPKYYGYAEAMIASLEKNGCEVDFFPIQEFYDNCPFWQRKLYKFGYKSLEGKWNNRWEENLRQFIREKLCPQTMFIICTGSMISTKLLNDLQQYKKVLYMWDSVVRYDESFWKTLRFYDSVYLFDYEDIGLVKEKCIGKIQYLPIGYDNIYAPGDEEEDIDVSFIGTLMPNRLEILDAIAEYIDSVNGTMYVGGIWYNYRFLKKMKFKNNHPYLYKFIDNRKLTHEELASIYRRSKICVNINNPVHKSISPRILEILATKSFVLSNIVPSGAPEEDFSKVMQCYSNKEDMMQCIDYYLKHDDVRKKIAEAGYEMVKDKFSLDHCMKIITSVNAYYI